MTSLREGLAAVRIAEYINQKFGGMGTVLGPTGAVIVLENGKQCNSAGTGKMYEEFKKSGQIMHYSGFGKKPTEFYDADFSTTPYRSFKFDQTYYRQPYDCRGRKYF